MHTTQTRRRLPKIQFRVLVVGRANAGKTSILQRVCETTESPTIYRGDEEITLNPSMERGEHSIDDALVFSNHKGYVFHDSQGIESGDEEKLDILKEFIRRKCGEKSLQNRLHAIWYCVPMDDHRPGLNLRFYESICPDQNVPVIAVFTKYDQFLFNVEMDVLDDPDKYPDSTKVAQVAEKRFQDHYLRPLGDGVRYVQLESDHCKNLVEKTAEALNEDAVALMLLTVQKSNLELSVNMALRRCSVYRHAKFDVKDVIKQCLFPFPYIWVRCEWLWCLAVFLPCSQCLSLTSQLVSVGHTSLHFIHQQHPSECDVFNFVEAVILFLKHTTFLKLSTATLKAALTQAELDYQESNIDLKIQEYLKAFSSGDASVVQFSGFIKATEIGARIVSSQSSVKTGA
ncbi:hypothetical protein V8E53_001267 [Lactarius tabidus]